MVKRLTSALLITLLAATSGMTSVVCVLNCTAPPATATSGSRHAASSPTTAMTAHHHHHHAAVASKPGQSTEAIASRGTCHTGLSATCSLRPTLKRVAPELTERQGAVEIAQSADAVAAESSTDARRFVVNSDFHALPAPTFSILRI